MKLDSRVVEYEFRLTPPAQQAVDDWKLKETFQIVVIFTEGEPHGSPKLHYHGYIKATCGLKTIQRWLNEVAESDKHGVSGNAVFFTRRVHEHTFGYISKLRNCVLRHGTDQTTLDEWYASSEQYLKEKVTEKKRKERTRAEELAPIWERVKTDLKSVQSPDPSYVVNQVLYRCWEANVRFPTRMALESFVIHALYEKRPEITQIYFQKAFQFIL